MVEKVTLPELGENVETAVVVLVLVSPGDAVRVDQPLLELETEKATAELPSPFSGVVKELLVEKGDEVRVGQELLTIEVEVEGDRQAEPARPEGAGEAEGEREGRPEPEPEPERAPAPEREPEPEPLRREAGPGRGGTAPGGPGRPASGVPHGAPEADVPAGPAVRRLARELGLDVSAVPGSGPRGRISIEDVKAYARELISSRRESGAREAEPGEPRPEHPPLPDLSEWGEVEREPMSGVRRKTARQVALAWAEAPQVTQSDRADVTELERARKLLGPRVEAEGAKLTPTAIVLKVVATALRLFPKFNAAVDMENLEVVYRKYVNLGVAVDAGHGLLVPVIREADRKSIARIAAELGDLSSRARAKKLAIEEMRGAGFTVTNLGGLGTTTFSPILSWPEVAILGIGRAETQAVFLDGRFEPRLVMPLSLTYDHRVIDGADAARFLRWIAEALEQPLKLALEG